MAERQLPKLNVAGSIPVSRSTIKVASLKQKRPPSAVASSVVAGWRVERCPMSSHQEELAAGGLGCLSVVGKLVFFERERLGHVGKRFFDLRIVFGPRLHARSLAELRG